MKVQLSGKDKNLYADVDNFILQNVLKHKWYLHTSGYVKTSRAPTQYLHHFILGKPPVGMEVDHINLNKLDNRKSNLRFLTIAENRKNKKPYYKPHKPGRWSYKRGNKYYGQIRRNGKNIYLGTFSTAMEVTLAGEQYLKQNSKMKVEQKTKG